MNLLIVVGHGYRQIDVYCRATRRRGAVATSYLSFPRLFLQCGDGELHQLRDVLPSHLFKEDDSFVSNIPAPAYLPLVGIIAGRYDGKVALDDTRLPDPLPYKRIVVDCTHPGLRNPSNVINPVLEFFSCQSFQTENMP